MQLHQCSAYLPASISPHYPLAMTSLSSLLQGQTLRSSPDRPVPYAPPHAGRDKWMEAIVYAMEDTDEISLDPSSR